MWCRGGGARTAEGHDEGRVERVEFVDAGRAAGLSHVRQDLVELRLQRLLHVASRLRLQLATVLFFI